MNPDKSSGDKSTRRRVKVYKLNDEGQWDDVGTGHVACVHHETFDALALTVKSEEKGGETILESKIQTEDIYQLQQDTLIVWQEPESGLDLALSFQEEQGCKEVWEQICAVQGRNPSESSEEVVTEEESYFSGIKLPPANLSNLQKMNGVFDGEHNSHMKERLANSVATQGYLTKLIELFKVVEESGNQAQLHLMFNIFKNLVLLNDPNLMETMFNDQNYMTTVGALEYDPEVSPKLEHRKYLQNSVVFKEVVPIRNADILKKIHQTFRIQYLKDVILPRLLDDMTFATINSIIYFNNVEIVDHLYKDTTFLTELFSKFRTATKEELVDLLGFLQEFCSLAKNLQIPQQRDFYQALAKYGMFEIFETALAESNIKIRLSCADLVNNVLSHDPVHFREFLLAQRPDYPLFHKLIDRVLLETDVGLLSQFVEVIRILVDTETMEETTDKEKFLTLFYQTFMKGLMAPIMDVDVKDKVETPAEAELKPARRQELCELLAYCCQHHGYHIKYFTLGNNIAAKVSKLLSSTQPKHVALAALRFFRAMVAAKDDFYNRHIMKFKLFDPIVQLFVANGRKYNLINSAVIELFDYIRKENIKALLKHVIENYSDTFKEVDYVETFKLLQLKYEQNKDYDENVNKVFSGPTKSPQRAAGDDVDDSYFFGDDDDDEEPKGGLVSYEDDEDKGKEKSEEEEKEEDHVDNVDDDSDDMQVDDADEEGQEGEEAQGVGHLLRLAQTYKCHELEKLCAEDLARNFSTLCESGKLNTLPLSTFIELIKSEKVAAAEEEIFDAVVAYVKFQRDTQGLDEAALLEQLLLFVRFPFIQSQRLVEDVEGNPLIAGLKLTGELLFEAYRYNFYSQLYNQNILSPKSQQPASLSHADGEESLYLDYATKSSTAKGPKFAFTSPLPHYELRCSPRSGAVKWNSTKKSRDIAISNSMLTASHNGSSSVWMSVVADVPFSDHLTSIYVHIDRNASNWIFIGVAEEQWMDYAASSGNYLGVSAGTWSHGSAGGYGKVHNGVAGAYGVSFATGDTVGVHLNPETGVLSFSCNGRNYGPAYLSLPVSKRLFLAVSLYHHSDQVTLARGRPKKFKAALNSIHPAAALPTDEEEDPNLFGLFG